MNQTISILTERSFSSEALSNKEQLKKIVIEKLFPNNAPFKRFAFVYDSDDTCLEIQKLVTLMHNLGFQHSKTWKYIDVVEGVAPEVRRMVHEHFNVIVLASTMKLVSQNVIEDLEANKFDIKMVQFELISA